MTNATLSELNDDVVIHICSLLTVRAVLSLRQTSRRFLAVTKLLVVWRNLVHNEVSQNGYPFPAETSQVTDPLRLEHLTRRACQIASFWLSGATARPRLCCHFDTFTKGTAISEIKFLPGSDVTRFVTVSKGIWSVVTCWELGLKTSPAGNTSSLEPRMIAEWCPRSVILTGFAVNSDPDKRGLLAVSVNRRGVQSIEILALEQRASGDVPREDGALSHTLTSVRTIEADCVPVLFEGSVLVITDAVSETHIVDWETTRSAVLRRPLGEGDPGFAHNKCLQALLTPAHVCIARARVIELYARPTLLPPPLGDNAITRPISQFSFGWVDGLSVTAQPPILDELHHSPSISIMLRSGIDDPWSSDISKVDLYSVRMASPPVIPHPPPQDTPDSLAEYLSSLQTRDPIADSEYLQPTLVASLSYPSARRTLHCPTVLSGRFGTSVWICPPRAARSRREAGLVALDVHASPTEGIDDARALADAVPRPGDRTGHVRACGAAESEVLVGALFPGPLRSVRRRDAGRVGGTGGDAAAGEDRREDGLRSICTPCAGSEGTGSRHWTSMDYAEEWGRVILGSNDGTVTFVEL